MKYRTALSVLLPYLIITPIFIGITTLLVITAIRTSGWTTEVQSMPVLPLILLGVLIRLAIKDVQSAKKESTKEKKLTRIVNEKRVIQFTLLVMFIGVMLLVFQIHQLDKALTQEKYLHQQSVESLSGLVQYYSDYSTQLENTIKDWRVRYDINEPLVEKEGVEQ